MIKTTWCPSKQEFSSRVSSSGTFDDAGGHRVSALRLPTRVGVAEPTESRGEPQSSGAWPPPGDLLGKDLDQPLPQRGFSPGPAGDTEGRLLTEHSSMCCWKSHQIPAGSIPWKSLAHPPPALETQEVVEDPLKRGRALPWEDARRRADFWFSLL